jgi:hypothetical protein
MNDWQWKMFDILDIDTNKFMLWEQEGWEIVSIAKSTFGPDGMYWAFMKRAKALGATREV